MKTSLRFSVACSLFALGCGALPEESDGEAAPGGPEGSTPTLAYGVPVAPDEIVTLHPPLDGDFVATEDPLAHLNRAADPELPPQLLRRSARITGGPPTDPPGTGDRGFYINVGDAIYARSDLQKNLTIPSSSPNATIYAPTHMPAGASCIEMVTVHYRVAGSVTTHAQGFWDWCRASPGWGTFDYITPTWELNYARSDGTELIYDTQVYKSSSNCWTGIIWNFLTGQWNHKLTSCGTTKTGQGNTGWTMWESWNLVGCPSLPRVKSHSIQIRQGAWKSLLPAHTTALGPFPGTCFQSGAYRFAVILANHYWEARTP